MWLLDVNVPRKTAAVLGAFGVQAVTAESRGWRGLTNGELVEAAAEAGFTILLTRDRLFSESAAAAIRRFPHLCIVLIALPQLRGEQFLEKFRLAWEEDPIRPTPGIVLRWPASEP